MKNARGEFRGPSFHIRRMVRLPRKACGETMHRWIRETMRRTRSAGAGLLTAALGLAACDTAPELSSDQTQAVTLTAAYDTTLKAPACRSQASSCDSGTLLLGRWTVGPEPNAPNTIHSDCWDGTLGSYHTTESIDRLA